jgi:hypothetical protein
MRRWFPSLRAVAWLKRIALALEKANRLREEEMAASTPRLRKASKVVDIGVADPEKWNKAWRERQAALRGEDA